MTEEEQKNALKKAKEKKAKLLKALNEAEKEEARLENVVLEEPSTNKVSAEAGVAEGTGGVD